MNRSYLIAGGVLVAAILWIAAGQLGKPAAVDAGPVADPAERPLQTVRIARLTAQPLTATIVIPGRTEAVRAVDVKAEVSGRIAEILAERGSRVTAGQPIARIAENARTARVAQARALLAQKRLEFKAAEQLSEKGFNSQIRYAEMRAQLDAAEAELRQAETDLQHLEIRAPFDGVLESRTIELGDFVEPGTPIGTVVDLDPIRLVGFATERDIGSLRVGHPATARLVTGREIQGTVSFVAATAQESTRTFRIEVEAPNPPDAPEGLIVEGLTAELRFPVAEQVAHKVSPGVLSLADDGAIGVKIVDADDTVRFLPVVLLGTAPDGAMWLGGLPETIAVITVGQDFVVDGQKVAPKEGDGDGLS